MSSPFLARCVRPRCPFPDSWPAGRTPRIPGRRRIRSPRSGRRGGAGVSPRAADAFRPRGGGSMGGPGPWQVAPDPGRPYGRACAHLDLLENGRAVPAVPAAASVGCSGCLPRGLSWIRLRQCVTCGYVGCCDSSRGRHCYAHHVESGHPVAVSLAPDEDWAWCFHDEVFLVRAGRNAADPPAGGTRY
ncbi:UBP-type zinc finger domain-containing protein [Streptomyces yangpuensis]|uniref:UBP-type zinc finger domain-containing protein n=2 Tax=Streptomyces yangpuensis TaxID=1648182 RepID=UPI003662712B